MQNDDLERMSAQLELSPLRPALHAHFTEILVRGGEGGEMPLNKPFMFSSENNVIEFSPDIPTEKATTIMKYFGNSLKKITLCVKAPATCKLLCAQCGNLIKFQLG